MRREAVLAIVIGFSVGIIISAGLLLGRKNIRQKINLRWPTKRTEEMPLPTPTHQVGEEAITIPKTPVALTITFPEDESIINEEKIVLTGETTPEAIISIVYEEGEALGEADENGDFSFEIPLIGGTNEITITAYNLKGEEASKTITVVYTTAEI